MEKKEKEEILKSLERYYQKCDLWIPENLSWRIIKFRLINGEFIQLNQVSNKESLRKNLLKYLPLEVWYSASTWLNPKKVRGRLNTSIADNLFIYNDLVFDIDNEDLEVARIETLKLIQELKVLKIIIKRITFTGSKGFHVVCDRRLLGVDKPFERIKQYEKDREEVLKTITAKVDKKITTDMYRIIRLPNSVHRSGRIAINIQEKDLNSSTALLLSKIGLLHNPISKEMLKSLTAMNDSPSAKIQQPSRVSIREPAQEIADYVKTNIEGTKRLVPFFRYKSPKKAIMDIKKLSRVYGLGGFYILIYPDEIGVLSLRAIDFRRLEKMYNSSQAINKTQITKFKTSYIKIKEGDMKIVILYEKCGEDKEKIYSNPHSFLIKKMGQQINEQGTFIGNKKPGVIKTRFK